VAPYDAYEYCPAFVEVTIDSFAVVDFVTARVT
jgi:hypothetical protein